MGRKRNYNVQEYHMIRNLDNLKLYEELMPAIRAVVAAKGGADAILKKSEVLAIVKIIELIGSEKPDVALKAAIEIANRSLGKPVERTVNIYGDISKLNERDIDNEILKLVNRSGAQPLIEAVIEERPKIKQKRKPRKVKLFEQTETSTPVEGALNGTEERASKQTSAEGTGQEGKGVGDIPTP